MLYEIQTAADKRPKREKSWQGIIIHATDVGGRKEISPTLWDTLSKNITEWLTRLDDRYVSAHYVIHRRGKIVQLVDPDKDEAFHAGVSLAWHPVLRTVTSDWNRYAIGIELIGDGDLHEFSEAQYKSLTELIRELMKKYPTIHPLCITGHQNISPGRKWDPGNKFDWKKLFKGIYGR